MEATSAPSPNPKVDAIITNISQLMAEAEQMLKESTSQHAEEQVALLRPRGSPWRSHLGACCTHAGRALAGGARQADHFVRSHPYQAVTLGIIAGLAAGALLRRRGRAAARHP
jgi:ElaB/YqjD/DUF883 family membrane-anchored ribosome-binding protein